MVNQGYTRLCSGHKPGFNCGGIGCPGGVQDEYNRYADKVRRFAEEILKADKKAAELRKEERNFIFGTPIKSKI